MVLYFQEKVNKKVLIFFLFLCKTYIQNYSVVSKSICGVPRRGKITDRRGTHLPNAYRGGLLKPLVVFTFITVNGSLLAGQ